ncbi:ArsR/SmtB family transcription factor [Blastococcus sp. SYSU D00813]
MTAPPTRSLPVGRPATVPDALSAMAHPVRRHLLCLLVGRDEVEVAAIRRTLGLSKPAVNYHARILADAGLIDARRRGRTLSYALRPAAVSHVWCELGALAADPA